MMWRKVAGSFFCGICLVLLSACDTEVNRVEIQQRAQPTMTITASPFLMPTLVVTPTPTVEPTRTAPPPQPALPKMDALPGMVLESQRILGNHEGVVETFLWTVDINRQPVFLAKGGSSQNLLSPDQRWLLHIESIPEASANYVYEMRYWLLDRSTATARRIFEPKNCRMSDMFSWSLDSMWLYYMAACGSDRNTDIWALNTSTWETKNITNTPERQEWCFHYTPYCRISSPNLPGKLLFTSSDLPRPTPVMGAQPRWESDDFLTQVDEDGKNHSVLDNEHGIFGDISLAPDGSAIAYDGGFILLQNGRKVQLTPQDMQIPKDPGYESLPASVWYDAIDIVNPAWSPDGKKIAWDIAHIDGRNHTGVATYDLKTQKAQLLLTFDPYYSAVTICTCEKWQIRQLVWSPDGQYLAFSNLEFPDREVTDRGDMFAEEHSSVWVFDQDGKKIFAMYGAALYTKPIWSPDRQWLGFGARDRDMRESIVVVKVGEWKPYQIDLPFEDVKLIDWLNQR